ncbi:MAG TPA: hypothetical protein VEC01_20465 [Noviherbaspirillum sp.]|uniref:hypothetical protein n=1 Tax=Noviherbaspirillum sp. TaxID=1926288 RepID=UPI002D27EED5|nr:hypothetical protein [Noviherbaspirillum sp.]HYD97707.1 hypothetical protein [Noviherbaspirillum sp.]
MSNLDMWRVFELIPFLYGTEDAKPDILPDCSNRIYNRSRSLAPTRYELPFGSNRRLPASPGGLPFVKQLFPAPARQQQAQIE